EPEPVGELTVIWVAAAGILINGGTALMFMRGRAGDLNVRAAFLHMAGDAGVSAGVVVAGILIGLTGWLWLDPAASLAIGIIILATTWGVLRDSTDLAMDAVPGGIEREWWKPICAACPGSPRCTTCTSGASARPTRRSPRIWSIRATRTAGARWSGSKP